MPVYEYAPHALLKPYIHSFCATERVFGGAATFDILPDSLIELVWSFGAPCALVLPAGNQPLPPCYVVGLLGAPLRITAEGLVQTVRARCYPWGVAPLLGAALRPTGLPHAAGLLWLAGFAPWQEWAPPAQPDQGAAAVALMQRLLLGRTLAASLDDPEAAQAAQALMDQHGDLALPALARQLGLSERTLRRRFRSAVGTSPKAFARLARFERVRDRLWQQPEAALGDLALEAGYSDQAHMQREFRAFSSYTPGRFAAEMRALRGLLAPDGRNLQDP